MFLKSFGDTMTTLAEPTGLRMGRRLLLRWAPLPLRLIIGYGFLAHGYAKVAHGPEKFIAILHAMGVPAPEIMAWATIAVELIGRLAVLLGAFIPLLSLPMAVVLLVATFTVHLPYGFSSIKLQAITPAGAQFGPPGYETDLLYLAGLATLVLAGPGSLSVAQHLAKPQDMQLTRPRVVHDSSS
jgi:putative oxidoreductase